MGWDNWNAFACDVDAELIQSSAEAIVDLGLKDMGYEYVILDDCWSVGRNTSGNGSIIADLTKFPNGMAAVAEGVHDLGLKFGMYSSAGKYTCGQYEGSLGHEDVDAQTWANWGVDYLKYDVRPGQKSDGIPPPPIFARAHTQALILTCFGYRTATTRARQEHKSSVVIGTAS